MSRGDLYTCKRFGILGYVRLIVWRKAGGGGKVVEIRLHLLQRD